VKRVGLDGTESERWFDVVAGNGNARAATMTLAPGDATGGPDNYHDESDQWLHVVSGEGAATVDGREVALAAGDLVRIDAGETRLETLNLCVPPEY